MCVCKWEQQQKKITYIYIIIQWKQINASGIAQRATNRFFIQILNIYIIKYMVIRSSAKSAVGRYVHRKKIACAIQWCAMLDDRRARVKLNIRSEFLYNLFNHYLRGVVAYSARILPNRLPYTILYQGRAIYTGKKTSLLCVVHEGDMVVRGHSLYMHWDVGAEGCGGRVANLIIG